MSGPEKLLGIVGAQATGNSSASFRRDRAPALAYPQRDDAGVGRRRAHAAVMGLRGAREAEVFYERASGARMHAELFSGSEELHTRNGRISSSTTYGRSASFLKVCDDIEGLLTRKPHLQAADNVRDTAWSGLQTPGVGFFRMSWCAARRRLDTAQAQPPTNSIPSRFRHPDRQEGDNYDRY